MQEYGRELEREVSARRVARNNDVGCGHALVQQVLDSSSRLAQLGWKGVLGARAMSEWSMGGSSTSRLSGERTVVEKGESEGTIAILLKGREHLEMVLPSWKNKSPALRAHRRPRSN